MFSEQKMLLAENLSLMMRGGVSLAEALEIIAKETKSKIFKKAVLDILQRVLQGESLSRALAFHPKIFDRFFQNIVKVGEQSGQLEENLNYLSETIEREMEAAKKIKGAMIYPIIVVSLALIVAFGATFFVLPKFVNLFQTLNIQLPLMTKVLISFTVFVKKYWLGIVILAPLLIFSFRLLGKIAAIGFWLDKIKLNLPILARIIKNRNLAFFSRNLYALLKSGTPIVDSLGIIAEIIPNKVYRQNLFSLLTGVEGGGKISENLKKFPQNFPLIFSEMILVGEKSGTLEESLLYLARRHEKEVEQTLKNLSAVLEPALLIAVGLFVAFITLSVITPIYKFTGQLRFR